MAVTASDAIFCYDLGRFSLYFSFFNFPFNNLVLLPFPPNSSNSPVTVTVREGVGFRVLNFATETVGNQAGAMLPGARLLRAVGGLRPTTPHARLTARVLVLRG